MRTLNEEAKTYEPPKALTVADLDILPLAINVQVGSKTDKNDKPYNYKFVELNGIEYRVPNPVIEQIQTILETNAEVKKVSVTKSGEGLATKYKVRPLL